MLIYHKPAPPKPPKRRSRAGCIFCKEKKKKCNEKRPQCDRCEERNVKCEYEAVKPRKRRRQSSALSQRPDSPSYRHNEWSSPFDHLHERSHSFDDQDTRDWQASSPYTQDGSGPFDHVSMTMDDDVEEIVRSDSMSTMARSRSQYPDLAMIAPSPVASPLLDFSAPVFMEFAERRNRRALVDHFCNVLSHLIVFKEDTGNPFRQLVLPLSHESSPVLDAIFALSSAHLENRGIEIEEKSLFFHNRALQGLAKLIDQGENANREEVLGAIMLLVYYEVLVQRGSSNMVNGHLKGAMTVLKSQPPATSPTSMFLERAFRFYDVIAALSFGTSPICSTPAPLAPFNLPTSPSASPLNSVDSLLGMATDLWPIIHRLSHLRDAQHELQIAEAAGNTSKSTVLRTELESTSHAIELALTNWTPSIPWPTQSSTASNTSRSTTPQASSTLEFPPSPPLPSPFLESPEQSRPSSPPPTTDIDTDPSSDGRLQSILNNAEAYRQAAFVFLYRDVKLLPRRHCLVQKHVRLTLLACERVVSWAGPMSALLWPLFIGSIEAVNEDDRETARKAFDGTERRQGMRNIIRAWEIVEDIWRRVDEGEEGVEWRDICEAKGVNIVFG